MFQEVHEKLVEIQEILNTVDLSEVEAIFDFYGLAEKVSSAKAYAEQIIVKN